MVALGGENVTARGSVVLNSRKRNSVSSRIPSLFTKTSMHSSPSAVNTRTSETGVKSLPPVQSKRSIVFQCYMQKIVMIRVLPCAVAPSEDDITVIITLDPSNSPNNDTHTL